MSIQTSIPHKPSLSGHQQVSLSYSQERVSNGQLEKIWNGMSQFNQYLSYKPHSSFEPTWIFGRFCVCPSNDAIDKKNRCWYWGPTTKTGSTRDKTNIVNPKVNRGCPPLTANPTSDKWENSLGPSIQNNPLYVYHTGDFFAMGCCSGSADQCYPLEKSFNRVSVSSNSSCSKYLQFYPNLEWHV